MHSARSQLPHDSSSATRKEEGRASGSRGQHIVHRAAGVRHYEVPRERGFSLSLAVSIGLFVVAVLLGGLIPPEEKLPPMIEVDLGIDVVENEPPPLGEPDAGAGEQVPEPMAEAEPEPIPEAEVKPPEPIVEPTPEPEPIPEPEPVMEQEPAPEPKPEFVVPKEEEPPPAPKPKPKPKPVAKVPPKQRQPARTESTQAPAATGPAGSGLTTGRAGVRGSPGGKPGGRGGGRGDFISTPHPQYDSTARQRGYQGRGTFMIRYENGRIVSVTAVQSTGVSYLDARSIAWISSRWRVKKGTSGAASLPITWRLR